MEFSSPNWYNILTDWSPQSLSVENSKMSTLSKNARKQTIRMIRYRPLWFVSQRKFLSTPCQTTRGVYVHYFWSVLQMGCLKKKLFVSNKYLSVLQKVYSTNCYQNFQTLTVNKRKQTCLHCFFKPYKSRKMHNSTNKYYDGTYKN